MIVTFEPPHEFVSFDVPNFHRSVRASKQVTASDCECTHCVLVRIESFDFLKGFNIPHFDCFVSRSAENPILEHFYHVHDANVSLHISLHACHVL